MSWMTSRQTRPPVAVTVGPCPSNSRAIDFRLTRPIGSSYCPALGHGATFLTNRKFRTERAMRDAGLEEAIRVAGGVGALAQKSGISQPSVSNWARVPAERVVAVEAATGVARGTLRPDLYGEQPADAIDEGEGGGGGRRRASRA